MSELICRNTMMRCVTPGMCSPHGGCRPEKSEWQMGYDEGRRMGTKHMYAEVERLKAENEALRKAASDLIAFFEMPPAKPDALADRSFMAYGAITRLKTLCTAKSGAESHE